MTQDLMEKNTRFCQNKNYLRWTLGVGLGFGVCGLGLGGKYEVTSEGPVIKILICIILIWY